MPSHFAIDYRGGHIVGFPHQAPDMVCFTQVDERGGTLGMGSCLVIS